MPLEKIARQVANLLSSREFVEIYAHHDVDGIAAASIIGHALFRDGGSFRIRVVSDLTPELLTGSPQAVLCDIGSGMADLPAEAVVIDHHVPHFMGSYHVNPRLAGLDGEKELSSAGAAYLVAQELGDNRDLVGLAILGMLGDNQPATGKNREILQEGIVHQFLSTAYGFLLPGRSMVERLMTAIDPYLGGFSGVEDRCRALVEECTTEGEIDEEALVSRLILEIAPRASSGALHGIYGTRYTLEKEIHEDAHTLSALVDACGKAGAGGLGVALCLRHAGLEKEVWEVMGGYRSRVIEGIRTAKQIEDQQPWFEVTNPRIAGNVADALALDLVQNRPVAVFSQEEGFAHVSLRTPEQVTFNLAALARETATACGGHGGGHETRAGAVIGVTQVECFKNGLRKAIAG
ncbi:MAG: DHH family phosphoesterase [Methanomicrobiales archaeon]|nr:DHH family phosphoesterase [Methanomicrobiales archaeon]